MSRFSESNLEKKLKEVNSSLQSIQTLSLWILHHRKHARLIVQIWHRELYHAKVKRKITLLYLANDIIQNGKKKAPDFLKEFKIILPIAISNIIKTITAEDIKKIRRIFEVWRERSVYSIDFVDQLDSILDLGVGKENKTVKFTPSTTSNNNEKSDTIVLDDQSDNEDETLSGDEQIPSILLEKSTGKINIKAFIEKLQELDCAPSTDAETRESISKLPNRITDIDILDKVKDPEELKEVGREIEQALTLLNEYNLRLDQELVARKLVANLFTSYIKQQTETLAQTEQHMKGAKESLSLLNGLRKDLKMHIDSLPDLSIPPFQMDTSSNDYLYSSEELFKSSTTLLSTTLKNENNDTTAISTMEKDDTQKSSNITGYFISPTQSDVSENTPDTYIAI